MGNVAIIIRVGGSLSHGQSLILVQKHPKLLPSRHIVTRAAVLNFEELSTLLCQVEACLNSRSLVPLSSDPRDVRILTPGHFLIGFPLLEIPDSNQEGDLLLTSRWLRSRLLGRICGKDGKETIFITCSEDKNGLVLDVQEFWVCWRLNNKQCSSPYTGAKPIKHAVQLEENGGLKLAFSRFSNICKMLMGLGLEKAIEIVRAAETSREQLRSMKETAVTVNSVKRNRSQNRPKQLSQEYECKKCGRKHKPHERPAYGKVCAKCNKKNHFAVKCFQNSKNIHEMKVPENELEIYIDSVTE
ncbi:hypothetical protein AVEN_190815-1 [Araneus ventricosus]|uniref:CCHC-type domain-containing protein n=1 Tax=Araneus ventricosus TaxID=182803 RepID=A0A4Y2E1E5_ARAVE|nr:hypothetical protein AVEN_190815-1 [Araneus ventricosus]